MSKNRDLTEGDVAKSIILFALPLLGAGLIQQLYSTVDLIFVGRLLGTEPAAAIGASDLLITCMVGFFTGMSVGTSVITAQLFGARNWEDLKKLIGTMFWVSVIGGLILLVGAEAFAGTFLTWMRTPAEIHSLAIRYLRIYGLSVLAVVIYNLLSGIIRALGDSRSPMIFQAIGGGIHILLDYILIVLCKMGVEGPALATAGSQTLAAGMAVAYLMRLKAPYALNPRKSGMDLKLLGSVMKVGVPSGVQSVVITLSNILIQAQINTLGVASIAAFTVYFKSEMFVYLPILSLGQAMVSFVGQNVGAGKEERIRQGNRVVILGGGAGIFLWTMLLIAGSGVLLSIFSKDPEVIRLAQQIVTTTFPFYFLYVVLEGLSGNLRGYGYAFLPMLVTVVSFCGFRVILLFLMMSQAPGVRSVASVYPMSWLIATILMGVVFRRFHRKRALEMQ